MNKITALIFTGVLAVFVFSTSFAKLTDTELKQGEEQLATILLNKTLIAKVVFPASKNGIDLSIDGSWNNKPITRLIKSNGIGIEIDEKATVTDVKLKDKHIEIHLNGGGQGTFGDVLLQSPFQMQNRTANKAAGGSRINLKFNRDITEEDISAIKLVEWLKPLVETSDIERAAAADDIPAEFKDAAEKKEILQGMSKKTVFAILGEPKNKDVDLDQSAPVEKWQYEIDATTNLLVTFEGGVVIEVVQF